MCSPKSDFSWPLSFAVAVFPGRQNEDSYVSVSCGELIFFLIKAGFVTGADTPRSESFHQWLSNPWFSARGGCSNSFHPCIPLMCSHLEEDGLKTSSSKRACFSNSMCFYNPYQFKDNFQRWHTEVIKDLVKLCCSRLKYLPSDIQTAFRKSWSLTAFSCLLQWAGGSCHSCSVLVQGITGKEYSEVHDFEQCCFRVSTKVHKIQGFFSWRGILCRGIPLRYARPSFSKILPLPEDEVYWRLAGLNDASPGI